MNVVPDVAALHLLANLQAVFDETGDGRASVQWRVRGRRASGEEWSLRRRNRYVSRFDIAFGSITEVLNQLARIETNVFEDVTFRRVKLRASVRSDFRVYRIESFEIWSGNEPLPDTDDAEVRAGDPLVLEAALRAEDGTLVTRSVVLRVPADASGRASISIGGGGAFPNVSTAEECLFDHAACEGETGDSFADLLDDLANAPKNNELVATLDLLDGEAGGPAAITSRRFSRFVDGRVQRFVDVVPAAAP
jgi:hypothetical protein